MRGKQNVLRRTKRLYISAKIQARGAWSKRRKPTKVAEFIRRIGAREAGAMQHAEKISTSIKRERAGAISARMAAVSIVNRCKPLLDPRRAAVHASSSLRGAKP